jgi:hypothetical protein
MMKQSSDHTRQDFDMQNDKGHDHQGATPKQIGAAEPKLSTAALLGIIVPTAIAGGAVMYAFQDIPQWAVGLGMIVVGQLGGRFALSRATKRDAAQATLPDGVRSAAASPAKAAYADLPTHERSNFINGLIVIGAMLLAAAVAWSVEEIFGPLAPLHTLFVWLGASFVIAAVAIEITLAVGRRRGFAVRPDDKNRRLD